ncbi:MAG: 7TM diverse intracellular signaling domain-containing protein, partial [Flavobacteriales bacterium]
MWKALPAIAAIATHAASAGNGPPLTVVADGSDGEPVRVEIAEDAGSEWTPEQALRIGRFSAATEATPNLGLSASSHWLRFRLANAAGADAVVLRAGNPELDEMDLYLVHGGTAVPFAKRGLARPLPENSFHGIDLSFTIQLAKGDTAELLLRVKANRQLRLPLLAYDPDSHARAHATRSLLAGIFIGILAVLALYNLFIFLSTRDYSYLAYFIYMLLVGITQLTFLGFSRPLLWPQSNWFAVNASLVLTLLTAAAASEFMIRFLDLSRLNRRTATRIRAFYAVFAACIFTYTLIHPLIAYLIAQIVVGVFASLLLTASVAAWLRGNRHAGYFLVAWSAFLIGTIIFLLKDIGLLPYAAWSVNLMPIGSAIEGILLSFALADRINTLRREKDRSQAEALALANENERLVREQNQDLERKVKERTAALQESNEHLKRTQVQLVQSEKMASLGQLTAGIAHEINNPINFISSNIAPLRRNVREVVDAIEAYRAIPPARAEQALAELRAKERQMGLDDTIGELDDIIQSIGEGARRTAEIVRGLRNFSRLDEDDLKPADIGEGIRSTLAVLSPQYRDRVEITVDLPELPKVECFPGKVNQVLMNILSNAAQATLARMDGRPRQVRVTGSDEGDRIRIRISDTGIGMTDEYKASHYFKRLTMIELALGNTEHHLRELARMGGLIEAARP